MMPQMQALQALSPRSMWFARWGAQLTAACHNNLRLPVALQACVHEHVAAVCQPPHKVHCNAGGRRAALCQVTMLQLPAMTRLLHTRVEHSQHSMHGPNAPKQRENCGGLSSLMPGASTSFSTPWSAVTAVHSSGAVSGARHSVPRAAFESAGEAPECSPSGCCACSCEARCSSCPSSLMGAVLMCG